MVVQAPGNAKVTDPAYAAQVTQLAGRLSRLPGVVSASNPLDPKSPTVSRDQRAAYSAVTYGVPAQEVTSAERDALMSAVERARSAG